MHSRYGENALVLFGKPGDKILKKEMAMFTVRFFDILTGTHGITHHAERSLKAVGEVKVSKGIRSWFKRAQS